MDDAERAIADELDALVQLRTGLCMKVLTQDASAQRLRAAMKRSGADDAASFLARLRTDPRVFDEFVSEITVPETYFFRDAAQFDFLREQVLSPYVGTDRTVRVWSAGCATGEEAYSLAVVLFELGLEKRASVVATDISQRALVRARSAEYSAWSLRGVPAAVVDTHFRKQHTVYRLDPRIMRMVSFHHHNLTSELPPPGPGGNAQFELIACKNVFIYLTPEKTQEVARRLASRLAECGWLVTGPSDPLLDIGDLCETFATSFGLCYRRKALGRVMGRPIHVAAFQARSQASAAEAIRVRPMWLDMPQRTFRSEPAAPLEEQPTQAVDDPVEQVRRAANANGSGLAERLCLALLAQFPMSPGLHYVHAVLLLDLRRELEAEAALRRVLYLDATLPVAHFLRGVLAARRNDDQACMRAFLCCQAHCESRDPTTPASFGDGIAHAALSEAARDAVRRLAARGGVS